MYSKHTKANVMKESEVPKITKAQIAYVEGTSPEYVSRVKYGGIKSTGERHQQTEREITDVLIKMRIRRQRGN